MQHAPPRWQLKLLHALTRKWWICRVQGTRNTRVMCTRNAFASARCAGQRGGARQFTDALHPAPHPKSWAQICRPQATFESFPQPAFAADYIGNARSHEPSHTLRTSHTHGHLDQRADERACAPRSPESAVSVHHRDAEGRTESKRRLMFRSPKTPAKVAKRNSQQCGDSRLTHTALITAQTITAT